jgi:hypothetical protein
MPKKKPLEIPRRIKTSLYCPECQELKEVHDVFDTRGFDVAILECSHRRTAFLPDVSERMYSESGNKYGEKES